MGDCGSSDDEEIVFPADEDDSEDGHGSNTFTGSDTSDDEEDDDEEDDPDDEDMPDMENSTIKHDILQWFIYFLLIWKGLNVISDKAIGKLLAFLGTFWALCGDMNPFMKSFSSAFPSTLYKLRRAMGQGKDNFEMYITCPKCYKLYTNKPITCANDGNMHMCREEISVISRLKKTPAWKRLVAEKAKSNARKTKGRNERGKTNQSSARGGRRGTAQSQVENSPVIGKPDQREMVKRHMYCNTALMKQSMSATGSKLKARKVYCYKYFIESFQSYLLQPNFEALCSEWRQLRPTTNLGHWGDMYDGKIWKGLLDADSKPFFLDSHSFGILLNVDWFCPFERRRDISVGVLYAVIVNLPRAIRFKRHNVIIIGIIPNLEKEPFHLNHYLGPFITELQQLWTGKMMKTHTFPEGKRVRVALIGVAADIPAARKMCGFVGHNARKGCSKCLKEFPGAVKDGFDFSGFDKEAWPMRTKEIHHNSLREINQIRVKSVRKKLESARGARMSILTRLPYFDVVTQHVVDPMHNLFLGTAKKMIDIWVKREKMNKKTFPKIDEIIATAFSVPGDVGRVPNHFASNWGCFTAHQWMMWTLIYSQFVLEEVLHEEDWQCWMIFVKAVKKIVKPVVSQDDIDSADRLFQVFGTKVAELYGNMAVTCNMHLHAHLRECIMQFGSVYGFWLFSFERYNGILTSYNSNGKEIEIHLMREFLAHNELVSAGWKLSDRFRKQFRPHFGPEILQQSLMSCQPVENTRYPLVFSNIADRVVLPKYRKTYELNEEALRLLVETYKSLYPSECTKIQVTAKYTLFNSIQLDQVLIGSIQGERSLKSSLVYTDDEVTREASPSDLTNSEATEGTKIARVRYFMMHDLVIRGETLQHLFARTLYFHLDNNNNNMRYGEGVYIYHEDKIEPASPKTFLPVQHIKGRVAVARTAKLNGLQAAITLPLKDLCYRSVSKQS